jgi:PAS domain S-box-containing protein
MAEERIRILMVEDDRVDRMAFERFVRHENLPYDCVLAGSVSEARSILAADRFDAALIDYLLGDGTAFDLFNEVTDAPIILITGSGDEEIAVAAMKAGASDYLVKDPAGNYLRTVPITVEHAIRDKRAEEELRRYREHLEELVAKRTAELIRANEQLLAEIVEREWAEEALRAEKERVQHYLEIAGVVFVALDAEGRITLVNKRGLEILGYRGDELIGQNWFETCLPERLRDEVHDVYIQLMAGEVEPLEYYENPVLTKDGDERTVAWHNSVLRNATGDIVGILSSGEDITERQRVEEALRESEEKYRLLIDNMHAGVVVHAPDTSIILSNRRACELLGLTEEQMSGKTARDPAWRFVREDRTTMPLQEYPVNQVITRLRPLDNQVAGINRPVSNDLVWVMVNAYPVLDEEERLDHITVTFIDVTERVRAEEALREYSERLEEIVDERTRELREAQEQLVKQERMALLGQVAGAMAHELNNPLGAIKNAAYFLNMVLAESKPEVKESLEIVEREVATSARIVNSLLEFTRVSRPVRRQVDPNEIIQETLSHAAVPEHIELVRQLDESLPMVLADPHQLAQVFGNLVLNAVQSMSPPYAEGRGGRLVIKSEVANRGDPGGRPEWVAVSVTDTGVGIPEENLGKLFVPLFTTKAKGIGLGLALVKILVEGHGGTIEVESQVGKGSTFTVKLPARGRAVELEPASAG